jgi:hypothetical protein
MTTRRQHSPRRGCSRGRRRYRSLEMAPSTQRPIAESWNRIRNAVDGYPHEIIRLIGESYGPDSVQHAWREFTNDESAQFSGDDLNVELFFSWLFHLWSPTPEKGIKVHDKTL